VIICSKFKLNVYTLILDLAGVPQITVAGQIRLTECSVCLVYYRIYSITTTEYSLYNYNCHLM
jgi:hypothetical protein